MAAGAQLCPALPSRGCREPACARLLHARLEPYSQVSKDDLGRTVECKNEARQGVKRAICRALGMHNVCCKYCKSLFKRVFGLPGLSCRLSSNTDFLSLLNQCILSLKQCVISQEKVS